MHNNFLFRKVIFFTFFSFYRQKARNHCNYIRIKIQQCHVIMSWIYYIYCMQLRIVDRFNHSKIIWLRKTLFKGTKEHYSAIYAVKGIMIRQPFQVHHRHTNQHGYRQRRMCYVCLFFNLCVHMLL